VTHEERVKRVTAFGFTERQAAFLVEVMLHSGFFLGRQYCTFAGCEARRCVCPGFACGADEVCIDDGGLACRELCTQDSDCPPPLGVCVNSTFGAGLCISSTPCQ